VVCLKGKGKDHPARTEWRSARVIGGLRVRNSERDGQGQRFFTNGEGSTTTSFDGERTKKLRRAQISGRPLALKARGEKGRRNAAMGGLLTSSN